MMDVLLQIANNTLCVSQKKSGIFGLIFCLLLYSCLFTILTNQSTLLQFFEHQNSMLPKKIFVLFKIIFIKCEFLEIAESKLNCKQTAAFSSKVNSEKLDYGIRENYVKIQFRPKKMMLG